MSVHPEVSNFEIKNGILPTAEITIRVINQMGRHAYFTNGVCDVYFGKDLGALETSPFVTRIPIAINQNTGANSEVRCYMPLALTGEILFNLDKRIPAGQDVFFILAFSIGAIHVDGNGLFNQGAWVHGQTVLKIATSDWAKLAYDWAKESVLVPMSPKTHEKLKDALRINKHLQNVDELITELLELHGNK